MTLPGLSYVVLGVLAVPLMSFAATGPDGQSPGAVASDRAVETTGAALAAPSPETVAPSSSTEPPASPSNSFHTLFRDLGGDFKHLPSKDSALVAAIGGGLALAVHPADDTFNQRLANDGGFFKAGAVLGNTLTLMGASSAMYFAGRAFGADKVAHEGLDLLRAQIVTEAMVQALKYTVQRPRPNGGSGYSFPSGHAAVTFATAVALDRHEPWQVAVPAYALATYVAASRLHDNVHNLSDVVFGAAVGTIAGRTVTRHVVGNFTMVPAAMPGGFAVMLIHTPGASVAP